MYSIQVDAQQFGMTRDELSEVLSAQGIETRPFFFPLHRLPPFREAARIQATELPETDRIAAAGLMLPTFNQLSDDQIDHICEQLRNASVRKTHGLRRVA